MEIITAPKQIWFFSDPHFGHASLIFGSANHRDKCRHFPSVGAMGQLIVDNINAVVRPTDHLYWLGDLTMNGDELEWLKQINCRHQRMLFGNHDNEKLQRYIDAGIKKFHAFREFDSIMFSHMPIAPWSMRWKANVHGHCHLAKPLFYTEVNPNAPEGFQRPLRYINISCEHTQYRPVPLEEIQRWAVQ